MEIGKGPLPPAPTALPKSPQPGGGGLNRKDDRVARVERETMDRMRELEQQVKETERTGRGRMEEIKDEYIRQNEAETSRQESSREQSRLENYEELRKMKRAHHEQISNLRRENEREASNLKSYYEDSIHREARRGDTTLSELQRTNERQREYETMTRRLEAETTAAEHMARISDVREKNDTEFNKLKKTESERFELARNKSEEAGEAAETFFQDRFKSIVDDQQSILEDTYRRGKTKLDDIRFETAGKLSAYGRRNQDPFYQLVQIGGNLYDDNDAFVLQANIPPHEQGNIAVAVRGNEIVVSGYRRSEDATKNDDGHNLRTASFQSFSESFPVNYPIDSRNVRREYDGQTLTVTFPKLPTYARAEGYQAKGTASLLRAERPNFPRALPITDEELKRPRTEEFEPTKDPKDLVIRKPRGGTTLG